MSKIVEKFHDISRPIIYLTHYRKNISLLSQQRLRLIDARDKVQQAVDMEEISAEEIESDMRRWLTQAGDSIYYMMRFLNGDRERSWKWHMSLRIRYLRSKKAKMLELEAMKLIERGKFDFEAEGSVSNRDSLSLPEYYCLFDDNHEIVKGIDAALKDENVKRIGVFGIEGVGKTRLVQYICAQAKERVVFDKVVWAIVGEIPNYEKIRAKIADGLDLDLEHVPGREYGSSWKMADIIRQRLSMKDDVDVLIILDDVWESIDLYDLGIPSEHRCKIIFTCRDIFVLQMMRCEEIREVGILSDDHSRQLFFTVVNKLKSPFVNRLIQEALDELCAGLPLTIVVAAMALRGKSDDSIFRESLELRKDYSTTDIIRGMPKATYFSIQLGFNSLESEEAKSMLLLCSLLSESNSDIPVDYLMFYGMGLQLIETIGGTLMEVRDKVYSLVENLGVSALLMDDIGHDYDHDHHCRRVRMHSIVRDVVRDISIKRDFQIYSSTPSKPERRYSIHESAAIWLSLSPSLEHELFHEDLHFPYLKLLTWKCNHKYSSPSLFRMPADFFEGMTTLNVLHLIEMNNLSLPPSISLLVNLRTLLIEYCMLEEENDHLSILGTLQSLEILSFYGSHIKELPIEIGQLTELRILNLSNCDKLVKIPPHAISRLSKLEGLYMNNSFLQWEIDRSDGKDIGNNLSIDELTSLSHLSELKLDILDDRYLPNDDILLKSLDRFYISIGDHFSHGKFYYPSSRTLKITGNHINDTVIVLLKRAEAIYLNELSFYSREDEHNMTDGDIFSNCRYLEVRNCVSIEDLINSTQKDVLYNHGRFCNMESLQVIDSKLEFLFLRTVSRCLVRLKDLKITNSSGMKYIVRFGSSEETLNFVIFPKLKSLTLEFLPSLISFSPSVLDASSGRCFLFNDRVKFPSLEELTIHGLDQFEIICDDGISIKHFPKLRTITVVNENQIPSIEDTKVGDIFRNLEQLTFVKTFDLSKNDHLRASNALTMWGYPKLMHRWIDMDFLVPRFSMNSLTELQIWNCSTLRYVFSSSTTYHFPCLRSLRIESCSKVQFIAFGRRDEASNNADVDVVSLPPLCSLILKDLPILTAFCTEIFNFCFDSLETLIITHCPQMKVFAFYFPTTDEVQSPHSSFFDDKVAFPNLVTLKLWDIGIIKPKDTPKIGESEIVYMNPLSSLFSSYLARQLVVLEVLEVFECKLEEIVAWKEDVNNEINFAQVHTLKIHNLPNLVRFCGGFQSVRWPSLTTLKVDRCPNLEMLTSAFLNSPEKEVGDTTPTQQTTILSTSTHDLIKQEFMISTLRLRHLVNLKEIWKDHYRILVFNHLSSLTIHECEMLRTLFSPTIVGGLSQLQDLIVDSCKMIEEIISKEKSGETDAVNEIVLPRLRTIELKHLPKLESFLSGEYKLAFPLLDHVRVEECAMLQTFSPRQVFAPNLNEVQIGDSQWDWKGDLESTIGHLFNGAVQYSEIEELHVNGPDKLIDILETKLHYTAFRRLKLLHVESCEEELRDFLSKLLFRFQELKKLCVENCSALEQLFNPEWLYFEDQYKLFVMLEELKLWNLPRLVCIWNKGMSKYVSLKNLKKVDICRCSHLVNLFSPSMARDLQQLQELKIRDCDTMKEVIASKTEGNIFSFEDICLPRLQHLKLIGLSNFMTFYSGICSFRWPCLHTLRIERCARLKSLIPGFLSHQYMMVEFPQLNQLYLKSLNDFEEIWQESVDEESFTKLQVLEIDDCGNLLNAIPCDMLPRLKKLEKLTIKNCPSLRKVFDLEAKIFKVKHTGSDEFTQLNELISTNLPDLVPDGLIEVFENLQVLKLSDSYRLNNLFSTSIARSFSELKDQRHPTSPEIIEEQSLQGKETVKIDYEFLPKLSFLDLDLSSLTMEKCPDLKIFFPAPRQPLFGQVVTFERLEELHLVHLGYFEQIWHDELPIRSLHRLRVLSVEKGERLLKIVPSRTLVNLLELEKLYVQHCDSLKQIFDLDEIMESITGELLPQLTFLVLTHLPEMVAIFSKQPIGVSVFSNLRSLRIIHCNSLGSLFSASTARGLRQLQEFKVFGCNKMQVVIVDDDKDTKVHMIFPKLRCLVLKHLPHLTSFYRGENTIKWLVLDEVRIKSVPVMETFAFGSQETPQLTTIYVTFLEKCWKGDLNETIQFLHKNKKWNAAAEMLFHEYEATSSRGEIQTISQPYATIEPVKHFPSALKINGSMIVEPEKDKGKEIMQDT